jgi:hypothetical protein
VHWPRRCTRYGSASFALDRLGLFANCRLNWCYRCHTQALGKMQYTRLPVSYDLTAISPLQFIGCRSEDHLIKKHPGDSTAIRPATVLNTSVFDPRIGLSLRTAALLHCCTAAEKYSRREGKAIQHALSAPWPLPAVALLMTACVHRVKPMMFTKGRREAALVMIAHFLSHLGNLKLRVKEQRHGMVHP